MVPGDNRFSLLPVEVIRLILQWLNLSDICSVLLVSRSLHMAAVPYLFKELIFGNDVKGPAQEKLLRHLSDDPTLLQHPRRISADALRIRDKRIGTWRTLEI